MAKMSSKKFEEDYLNQGSESSGGGLDEGASQVMQRFTQMSVPKQNRRETWAGVQRLMYPNNLHWIVTGESFNGPIRFPSLRDMVNALVDKYMENMPEAIIKPYYDEDKNLLIAKKAYIDYLKRQPWYKTARRRAILDMMMFGDGFLQGDFTHIQRKLPKTNDGKREMIDTTLFRDVSIRHVGYRNMFMDETALSLQDPLGNTGARDCIIRHYVPYSRYMNELAPRMGFSTKGVMATPFIPAENEDFLVTNDREVWEKSTVEMVKLYEYMNPEQDLYRVVVNNETKFEGSLFEAKGTSCIDVVQYKFEPRNDSSWSTCLAEWIAPMIDAKDQVFTLEMMNLKLTLQPVLAMSGDFGYNPRAHKLQPGAIWRAGGQLQGKVGDSISPIIAGNPNTRSYEMLQKLESEMTMTSRADLRNLNFSQEQTATQTMAIQSSQELHSSTITTINEVEAETYLTRILIEKMEAFMTDDTTAQEKRRKIPIKNYRVRQADTGESMFFNKNGYEDSFYMTNPMFNVPCRVEVLDKRSEKAAGIEQLGRWMQFIPMLTNIMQIDPEIAKTINLGGVLEQVVEGIGLEHSRTFTDDDAIYEDEFAMLREEIEFGNIVELPKNESRKESYARMRFLLAMKEELNEQMDSKEGRDIKNAFYHVFMQVIENISRNHLNDKYMEESGGGMNPEDPGAMGMGPEGMPGGQLPFQGNASGMSTASTNQALGGSMGADMGGAGGKTMPQPDQSVLNPSGRELI